MGDDAKNINNQITENSLGRDGADPNGEFDFWNDATGDSIAGPPKPPARCFAPGNGSVPLSTIYPGLPGAVLADQVEEPQLERRTARWILGDEGNPSTILGYAGQSPAQNQQCFVGEAGPGAPAV